MPIAARSSPARIRPSEARRLSGSIVAADKVEIIDVIVTVMAAIGIVKVTPGGGQRAAADTISK